MKLKLGVIGCGKKSSQYIDTWSQRTDIDIVCVCDPSEGALQHVKSILSDHGQKQVHAYQDWQTLLSEQGSTLDAVYICTPHVVHADQALAALELNLDVLLEKPMVTTVDEAKALQLAQQASGKQLVVAYQGGLSPLVHQLKEDIATKRYGDLMSINAAIWEDWADTYTGHWKQVPEISGGGFMFDTGAHMMNTTSMLCSQPFASVSAKMNNHNFPVDIVTTVIGELADGMLFSMHACGKSIRCTSRIECFFTDYVVRVCAWGRWIEIEDRDGNIERKEQESANNLMNVFLQTRDGNIQNPSDIEQGLHMAKLWDAIKLSASKNGAPVTC